MVAIRQTIRFTTQAGSCYFTIDAPGDVHCELTEIQQNVKQLLGELQASEHDKFAAHLYRSRTELRSACERAGKSGKQIDRA